MDYALPVIFAVAAWWFSTIVIIYRAGLPRRSFGATLAGVTTVTVLGIYALIASRDDVSKAGAYLAFAGALAVWGWHEVTYLFGYVSGPKPEACPAGVSGWQRFVLGVKTCAYHEMAVILTAALIAALTYGHANQVGLWTFVILWLMRWSAKLNIFLGVRNLHDEFWPDHLRYLNSFAGQRPTNELFPFSIIVATAALGLLVLAAVTAGEDVASRTGAVLLGTLLALAIVEHVFLVFRIRDDALWRAGMRSRRGGGAAAN